MASDIYTKYACTYCQNDIVGLRVKCCECQNFDICLQCFSAGAEIGPHKNDHKYQLVDSGALDFRDCFSWTEREETQLLNAVEQYGFGNWDDISQQMEGRTPEEAREEYVKWFLDGPIGRQTWWQLSSDKRPILSDLTQPDNGPLAPSATCRLPSFNLTPEEATQLGYMPLRDDFEREFDNEAEQLISSLPLEVSSTEEDELVIAIKLAKVDMYSQRLRERARKRRVARDYQLATLFFNHKFQKLALPKISLQPQSKKRALDKNYRDLEEKLRPYCQFHTATEHEQFLSSLVRERDLSRRLTELLRYRKNGLTRLEELPHFEQESFQRHNSRSPGSSALVAPSRHSQLQQQEQQHLQQQLLQQKGRSGGRGEGDTTSARRSWQQPTHNGKSNSSSLQPQPTHTTTPSQNSDINPSLNPNHSANPFQNSPSPSHQQQAGQHLLSSAEVQLCTTLELTPTQYISMKTLMLSDPPLKTETPAEQGVLNHLMTSGWLTGLS